MCNTNAIRGSAHRPSPCPKFRTIHVLRRQLTHTGRGTQLTSGVGTTNGWRNNNNYSVAITHRNQLAALQTPRKRCCLVVCERGNDPLNSNLVLSRESAFGSRRNAFISKVEGTHDDDVDPKMSLRTKNTRYNHILSRVKLHKPSNKEWLW